ncbi:hypothetical protein [Cellulomonas sp. P24]|jgi:hypothetical protein|uniref:hypothetical protein n=1 Tax=Cellulomonas sp. P24 TaxID=2885206 RepID=UPI00216AE0C2|nr:hypothetical protein [Cellulomonas sp. P24]MCR6492081.1 hypothetical protein [Cellulomonas sp. P24]
MAISGWLILAGVLLLYVALGLWAVSQIFPTNNPNPHSSRRVREPDRQQEDSQP